MYVFILILLFLAAGFCIFRYRKKRIFCKIRCMCLCDKISLLNSLLAPYGFFWLPSQNLFSSTRDSWQREFGYCALYDRSAPFFNMVFDCLPVYFNYQGKTWLIEFWKGQYGINTGCEVGIYHADSIIKESDYSQTLFHSASDQEMLPLTMKLFSLQQTSAHGRHFCHEGYSSQISRHTSAQRPSCDAPLLCVGRVHWWLTGFLTGQFHHPHDLILHASVSFPDCQMRDAFLEGLSHTGHKTCDTDIDGLAVSVRLENRPASGRCCKLCTLRKLAAAAAQFENHLFCRLYLYITRPFTQTPDRILCLYYLLPGALRHMLRFRRSRRMKHSAPRL